MNDQGADRAQDATGDGGARPRTDEREHDGVDPVGAWRAACGLGRWYLIARGFGAQVTPYAVEVDGTGVICVFTSPERATAFGRDSGLSEEEAGHLMAIPPDDATEYLLGFAADGIHAVVLDSGTIDAAILLAALPHIRQLALDDVEQPDT